MALSLLEAAAAAAQAGVSMAAPLALRGRGACSRMQLLPLPPLGGGRTLRSYIRIITTINNNDDDNNE